MALHLVLSALAALQMSKEVIHIFKKLAFIKLVYETGRRDQNNFKLGIFF